MHLQVPKMYRGNSAKSSKGSNSGLWAKPAGRIPEFSGGHRNTLWAEENILEMKKFALP